MKVVNLLIILLFNFIGALLSYCCYYQWDPMEQRVPIIYYGLCYFCFILFSIFILDKIKQPFALIILGVCIGILISFVFSIIGPLLFNPIVLLHIHNNILLTIIIYLFISSLTTLNLIIFPAILLCCHYSISGIQNKIKQ